MTKKVFDKLVDDVTERVVLRILNGHFVCYQCGERSIKERFEKLEQKVERCLPDVEIVKCKDCKHFDDASGGFCCMLSRYINNEDFFCGFGKRRKTDEH